MTLTERQRKHLRGLAHHLKPVVSVGSAGVTDPVIAELDQALAHHELVKMRVRVGDRDSRDEALTELVGRTDAILVQRIGNTAVLYRRNPDKPKISLPAPGRK